MRLTDLEPQFVRHCIEDGREVYEHVETLAEADGVWFLCPKCFAQNGGSVGTHGLLCWRPRVPPHIDPKPGRWEFTGTGLADLTLDDELLDEFAAETRPHAPLTT